MNFSQRLIEFRTSRQLSREDLANLIGVRPVTVLRWEVGASHPALPTAAKLMQLGIGTLEMHETKTASTPRLGSDLFEQNTLRDGVRKSIALNGKSLEFVPSSYVENGPPSQLEFFETLYALQDEVKPGSDSLDFARRLSVVASVPGLCSSTAQDELESPKKTAKHWNPNYGSHGWHRYVGRFPPQLVRALLNHFGAKKGSVVCDPFLGSGTTLTESRLLGLTGIGIEVCPLSALISRTKSMFPTSTGALEKVALEMESFYERKWNPFTGNLEQASELTNEAIFARAGNTIPNFSNHERWMTPGALLGTSIVVEFAETLSGYERDAVCCALSACMRSIGNLDVDVVRAEYSRRPRENVDVLKLVLAKWRKMMRDIQRMNQTHKDLMSDPSDITIIESSVLSAELEKDSVDFILTSPPYGVESVSYLRTHLLSYRSLQSILGYDPYSSDKTIIGSEYVNKNGFTPPTWNAANFSNAFKSFFDPESTAETEKRALLRRDMMVHFFDDMVEVARRFSYSLRPGGKVGFVIGNKRLGEKLIPTERIVTEIFEAFGLSLKRSIKHKLKCNNSNSEVPWQERIIQDEYILIFHKEK